VDWGKSLPFLLIHLTPLAVIWVGWSWTAVWMAVAMYVVRMFAITGFYHRYFSHRTYRAGRRVQFLFALLGNSAVQKGPLWWAGHHRFHHAHADENADIHSPLRHGFLWSHVGWILSDLSKPTQMHLVRDLAKFPELRFLDRHYNLVPLVTALGMLGLGFLLQAIAPQLGTSGPQLLVWGFFISTVALFHGTYTINSLSHQFGSRRYETTDTSRNNWFLALITLGEGWHNNHHRYPSSARQGFTWWEIDITWYGLWILARVGLIRDLRPIPARAMANLNSRAATGRG
jgi:stearoyl-CoA desaturase (delta-9 desaturase)